MLYLQRRTNRAGAQVSLSQFLPHVKDVGVFPLVAVEKEGFLTNHLNKFGIPFLTVRFPSWRSPLSWWIEKPGFMKRLKKFVNFHAPHGVDLVHGNNVGEGGLTVAVAEAFDSATVVHLRDGYATRDRLEKYRASELDGIICLTQSKYDQLLEWNIGPKVAKIYDSIDPQLLSDNTSQTPVESVVPSAQTIVLIVGSSDPRKGWTFVAEALLMLKTEVVNVECWFLGQVREDEVRAVRNILDRCTPPVKAIFLGHRDQVAPFYQHADLVLSASLSESFGRVVIEAGLFEKPLLASRVGVAAEIMDTSEYGYLFQPGDVDGLARAMVTALKDQDRSRKARLLHSKVMGECSYETHNKALRLFYDEVSTSRRLKM